jgi:cystathionine beta-lyase/cystathionine gamma-synthase
VEKDPMPPERSAGLEPSARPPGFATRAIHDADMPLSFAEQPVSPPMWLTSDYLYEGLDHYSDVINESRPGYVYGRYGNPTHVALHRVLASLEEAEAAWSFASGMAAVHTALTALVGAGDHVVAQRTVYGGTHALLNNRFPRYGVDVSWVAPEADQVGAALRPSTRAVVLETLANPTFRVADLHGVARVCREASIPLVVDNTIATPYLLRPLAWAGVALSINSTTKYIGGHSDLIGGAVAGAASTMDEVRHLAIEQGTTGGAFDAWLTLRGVQTLALRLERQCATALLLASFLSEHPKVAEVGYCGLPSHPDHTRASSLFDRGHFGAMLSFSLTDGYEAALRACDSLALVRVGSSFGSQRSQVCHPATTSHRQLSPQDRAAAGIDDGLIRMAVGGEDPEDLMADFEQALEKA